MSIKKIQEITGFSYSTISRVINGKSKEFRISDTTRNTILETAAAIHYRPNILARSLRMRKTYTIGLIVPDIQNPFFGELSWRIERHLREHGYSMILCNTNEIAENEEFYLKVLADRQGDGIIIAPVHTQEWPGVEEIRRERSIVLIDRVFYTTDIPSVTSANEQAAEDVAATFFGLGFSRIAFLGGTPNTYINTMRMNGYRNAFRRFSVPVDESIVFHEGYSPEAGEIMMAALLSKAPDIKAVFCVNNLVFIGAMKIVQEHEIRTGCHILMAAFDILRYCSIFKRPLICASQDQKKLASTTVSLLMQGIENPPGPHEHLVIPICINEHRID
jgi:LacI family transcriptional regulator